MSEVDLWDFFSPLALSLPLNEKVFQDLPVVCGHKWLIANGTINRLIYNFWFCTHSYHLVERLALRAFKFIVEHLTSFTIPWPRHNSGHQTMIGN
jgi:hypothetical protein